MPAHKFVCAGIFFFQLVFLVMSQPLQNFQNLKLKFILFLALALISDLCYAQNTFFIGKQKFPSTEKISFKMNAAGHYGFDFIIAKRQVGGLIALSTESMTGVLIRGTAYLYLDDGSIITLVDRKIHDYVDNVATTVYYLTEAEVENLRSANINKIRFSLKCVNCVSSEEGTFTAINEQPSYDLLGTESKIDIPSLVEQFYAE
jgi:hypothetical protein